MIVVCGSPRSGTSLMMDTLRILEVPVSAPKFHKFSSYFTQEQYDEYKSFNPSGYYEFDPDSTIDMQQMHGEAIKLTGLQLESMTSAHISKVIVCVRKQQDTVDSIIRSSKAHNRDLGDNVINEANKLYSNQYMAISQWLSDNLNIPSIIVNYESLTDGFLVRDEILRICYFIGRFENIEQAIHNVRIKSGT